MTETEETFDRETLLARNDASWTALWEMIDRQDEAELNGRRDASGWSAKDHLAHLAAWERGGVFLLNGLTVTDGMGVDDDLYRAGAIETINAEIQDQGKDLELADVLTDLRLVHEEMIGTIAGLSEGALQQLVEASAVPEGRPRPKVANRIAQNTFKHFDQHRVWIEMLLRGDPA